MITTLHIKNIGIIDDLSIDLTEGFNVFTGETGAGKTLIVDALSIISGGRFSKEMIRKGEEFSFVELSLFLEGKDMSIDNNVIVSREIHSNGRNSCKINGRLATVAELKEFMNNIIDIHGQNDNQKILDNKNHIKYLDNFAEKEIADIINEYKELYNRYCEIRKELKENLGDDKEKERKLDLLQYEYDEIEKANLEVDEEEKLKEKSILFANSEKIVKSLSDASNCSQISVDNINNAIKAIDKIANLDEKYNEKLINLKSIYYEIDEFSRDIECLGDDVDFDEQERKNVEERLDLIYMLKRKYGNSIKEILEYKKKIEEKISKINNLDETNNKLKQKLNVIEEKMKRLTTNLTSIRTKFANFLSTRINEELKDLEMYNSSFIAKIEPIENFNKRGLDNIEFYISTNTGEDFKELNKIASGGEMSRIMLAIKTVLANSDKIPVMIFDEIDTGISGKAAKSVGNKLRIIGEKHQVICITHQASIAAKGNHNYFISKSAENGRTFTKIKRLEESEIIDEIARISNGDITDIARKHAEELIKSA